MLDVDEDRIEPGDGRQRIGLVGGDQRAFGDADRPIRPLIGAGTRVKRRLICALRSGALFCATAASACRAWATRVGIILLGDRLHLGQRLVARGPGPRGFGAGPRALEIGLRLRGLRVIDAGVDLVERLALADERAFR